MFESLSYESLQIYWWIIIALLGGILVFLLFVQGGQTLFGQLSSNEDEKTVLVNVIGHKWEFTFSTLVVFGGAFFASFPLFYSTSFGGAYWVWYAILFAFIMQAVSYEYRKKENNFLGRKFYEGLLFFNGVAAPLLLGVAVSTFFTGSQFSIDKTNIIRLDNNFDSVISQWQTSWHGLEALWTTDHLAFLQNIALGLSVLFLARINALLYIKKMVNNENILLKTNKCLKKNSLLFLVFFLFWAIRLMFISGFAVNPQTQEIVMESNKYLHNLMNNPLLLILFLSGVILVLLGIYKGAFTKSDTAFWFSGGGTVLTVMTLFFIAAFGNTAYYPSTFDIQSSITLASSSSSKFTLVVMSYVSLMIPFVLAYVVWAWRAMDAHKATIEEFKEGIDQY